MKKGEKKIGFIGCGNMGGAILKVLVRNKVFSAKSLFACDADKKKLKTLCSQTKVNAVDDFEKLLLKVDVVILGVKPQSIAALAESVHKTAYENKLFISILAGTTISRLKKLFGNKARFIRTMPNLGLMQGAGMTAISKDRSAKPGDLKIAESVFSACGEIVNVPEIKLNAVTAVSGSGPAYYFYLTELLIQEGVKQGLKKTDAEILAKMTALGSSVVMTNETLSPGELRARVTSPGGTTRAAMDCLTKKEFSRIFSSAITAAVKRSIELSK